MHQETGSPAGTLLPRARIQLFSSARVVVAGLLASVTPLALLVFNRDWMFSSEQSLDAWHYVGLFHEYLNPSYSPGAYKLARLPWILAGFLVNQAMPPVPAAYALHALFLVATSLALFVGLYALFGRVALAGVVATLLGFYTHAHGSGEWDYHNTAAGAFYLLAFMMLALPSTIAGRRLPLIVAGAMTALAIHANITLINFLPALLLVHLKAVHVRTGHLPPVTALLGRCGWGAAGALLVTAVLGLINVLVGREFFFFALLTEITAQYVADPQRVAGWRRDGLDWVLRARYLALPTAVFFVGAIALLLRRPADDRASLAPSLILQFLLMSLVWVGWQMAGQLALDWSYFAYVLVPSCFIAIGGLLSLRWQDAFERYGLVMILGTAVACWLCLVGATDPLPQLVNAVYERGIWVVGSALLAGGFLVFLLRPAIATVIVFIAVSAFGNRVVASDPVNYIAKDPCQIQEQVYAAVVDGASWLGALDPTYSRVRTWFEQQEQTTPASGCPVGVGSMSGAMTTMAFVPYVTNPFPMPGVDAVPDQALENMAGSQSILAIITNKATHLDEWDRRLARMDLEHREVASHRVPLLASGFSIYAWEIRQKTPAATFAEPVLVVTEQTPRQVNVYGTPSGQVVIEGDRMVFEPTDARDHLAWDFAMFPATATDSWAQITIELPPSATNRASCRMAVQNPSLTTLAMIPCTTGTYYVQLPAGTEGLRVYLSDATRMPIVVPRRIAVALSTSAQ